ncbi:MAG: SCP2 sterol-binding domain-containing protein [Lachnospiraceae bacterium]|nr:SCP2 sterol-binding domain-containing protein [Lachnospiraceae bacterium]
METDNILELTSEAEKDAEKIKQAVVKKTFPKLFAQIKEKLELTDSTVLSGHAAYEFHISDPDGIFYVEISDGRIDVQPYDYHDNQGVFTASAATYEALCEGSLTPITAYAAGRLKISGGTDQVKVLMKIFA